MPIVDPMALRQAKLGVPGSNVEKKEKENKNFFIKKHFRPIVQGNRPKI
jgi:hypothetical protein